MEGSGIDLNIDGVVEIPSSSAGASKNSKCACKCNCFRENISDEDKSDPDNTVQEESLDDNEVQTNCQCHCSCVAVAAHDESNDLFEEIHKDDLKRSLRPSKSGLRIKLPKDEKKPKLRTSKDVYDRLKWDSASIVVKNKEGHEEEIDLPSIYVGYKDRFLGMCELPLDEFQPGGDIPFHRVYYFRTGGPPIDPFVGKDGEVKVGDHNLPSNSVFIWDRDTRTDLVFKSGNTTYLKR